MMSDSSPTSRFLNSRYINDKSEDISDSVEDTKAHWEDAIQFCIDRLDGKYGELNDEERESIEDELEIAKVNLEDAQKHLN